jgi:hypothetical protein
MVKFIGWSTILTILLLFIWKIYYYIFTSDSYKGQNNLYHGIFISTIMMINTTYEF